MNHHLGKSRTFAKQVKHRMRSWSGGGNTALWKAIQAEENVIKSANKFATATGKATASLLNWSKQEENNLLGHIFGRVAELNWMWKKTIDEFNDQYLNYLHQLETMFEREKQVEEYKTDVKILHSRLEKTRKQLQNSSKKSKGDSSYITALERELETLTSHYDIMQRSLVSTLNKLEIEKVTYVRTALKEQALAFVELAEKCQSIYCGQLAMVATIPKDIDMNFLTKNYRTLLSGIYNSVSSVSRNLESVPPPDGGIGAPEVIMAQQYHGYHESQDYGSPKEFYSTTTTTKTGDKKISVPPRSPQSLESALTASYVTPDELFVLKSSLKKTNDAHDYEGVYLSVTFDAQADKSEELLKSNLVKSYSDNEIHYYSSSSKTKPLESEDNSLSGALTASHYSCAFHTLEDQSLPPIPTNGNYVPMAGTIVEEALQEGENKTFASAASNIDVKFCKENNPEDFLPKTPFHLVTYSLQESDYESIYCKPSQLNSSLSLSSSMLEVSNKWKLSEDYSNPDGCYYTALQSIGMNSYQPNNPDTQDHNHQEYKEDYSPKINSPLQQRRRFSLDSSIDNFGKDFQQTQHLVKSGSFNNLLHSPVGIQSITPYQSSNPLSINDDCKQKNLKKHNRGKRYLKMFNSLPPTLFKKKAPKHFT